MPAGFDQRKRLPTSRPVFPPYVSPRHVTAGTAAILIGAPANLFQAVGVWRSRFRADASLINDAARLLAHCREQFPAAQVRRPSAAILRKRQARIKFVPAGDSADLTVTERGAKVLSKGRKVKVSDRGRWWTPGYRFLSETRDAGGRPLRS